MRVRWKAGGAIVGGAVAMVLLALLAGCGGGSDASASKPLSRAQLLKRAGAICFSEEARKVKALEAGSRLGKNFVAGSKKELEDLVSSEILPLYRKMIGELAALKPRVREREKWERLVGEYETALKKAEANPGLQLKDDSFIPVNRAATRFGVKECTL